MLCIVFGVALVLGGGDFKKKRQQADDEQDASPSAIPTQFIGVIMLMISLCFDGGLGAFEDKLVNLHSIQPFDLMCNIHLANVLFAGFMLVMLNEVHVFWHVIQDKGILLLLVIGLCGAIGQAFIFITITTFGAVTCSIMGLMRKITTICASLYVYGHHLHWVQALGLFISIYSMAGHPVYCCVFNNFGRAENRSDQSSN